MKHGDGGYAAGCRCEMCRKARRDYAIERRGQAASGARIVQHGSITAYANDGCRCGTCKAGMRERREEFRISAPNDPQVNHGVSSYVRGCRCDVCRSASTEYARTSREPKKDLINERRRQHRRDNRDLLRERERAHRKANQAEAVQRDRRYRELNRDKINENNRRWYANNRESARAAGLEYSRAKSELTKLRVKKANAVSLQSATRKSAPWTPQEDAVALRGDMTIMEIAFALSRTHSAVESRRGKLRRLQRHFATVT